MLIWALLLLGCLERVTGEVVPLDSRFTAQVQMGTGDDTGGPGHEQVEHEMALHEEVGPPKPFEDVEGPKLLLKGVVQGGQSEMAVELDLAQTASDQPGGLNNLGKIILAGPGPFELPVPKGVGELILRAFQDPDADGPSSTDAYGEARVTVKEEEPPLVTMELVVGGLEQAFGHVAAPPGAGSDHAPHPTDGGGSGDMSPFANYEGEFTTIRGVLKWGGDEVIDVDLFTEDSDQPGGRRLLGKFKLSAGAFSLDVPTEYGLVQLDVFADLASDGPSVGDPAARTEMIALDQGGVNGVMLVLETTDEAPPTHTEVGSGGDLEEAFKQAKVGPNAPEIGSDPP